MEMLKLALLRCKPISFHRHFKVTAFLSIDFFIWVLWPVKIISLILSSQLKGGAKTGDPRESPPDHPQAELGLSHMWPERGLSPQLWDDERFRALKISGLNHSAKGAPYGIGRTYHLDMEIIFAYPGFIYAWTHHTPQPLYNMAHYYMVLDIAPFSVRPP